MHFLKTSMLLALLLIGRLSGWTQRVDTLLYARNFIKICNAYKKIPLKLDLYLRNDANLVTESGDTASMHAVFYLQKDGSYVGFGELEQIADDSLMLIVSHKLKKIMVYPHHKSVSEQMKNLLNQGFNDSSVSRLAGKYTIRQDDIDRDTAEILVRTRRTLAFTDVPVEYIVLKYRPGSLSPYSVSQTRRNLLQIDKEQFLALRKDEKSKYKTIATEDGNYFVVKEHTTVFDYVQFSNGQMEKIPVRVSDVLRSENGGGLKPAGTYADYQIVQGF